MAMHSSTAAPAPSQAAALTASMVPLTAANTSDTVTIPVQIQAIAMSRPPFLPYICVKGRGRCINILQKMEQHLLT